LVSKNTKKACSFFCEFFEKTIELIDTKSIFSKEKKSNEKTILVLSNVCHAACNKKLPPEKVFPLSGSGGTKTLVGKKAKKKKKTILLCKQSSCTA
jgi:hypothetical protein